MERPTDIVLESGTRHDIIEELPNVRAATW
jgi:hypothetical protein